MIFSRQDDDDDAIWPARRWVRNMAPRVSDKHKKVIMKKCVLFNPERLVKWITLNYWAKFIFIQMIKNNYPQTWIINIWSPAFVVGPPNGLLLVISQNEKFTVAYHLPEGWITFNVSGLVCLQCNGWNSTKWLSLSRFDMDGSNYQSREIIEKKWVPQAFLYGPWLSLFATSKSYLFVYELDYSFRRCSFF